MKREMFGIVYLVIVVAMPEMMELFDNMPPNEQLLEFLQVTKCLRVCEQVVVAMKNAGSQFCRENRPD
jgi:hypothetical protein